MALRVPKEEDLPALEDLLVRTFDAESARHATLQCRRFVKEGGIEPLVRSTLLVGVDARQRIVGITGYYFVDASTGVPVPGRPQPATARLGWFGVHPEHRYIGAGPALLELTEERAARDGVEVLCIETSSNPLYANARRMYAAMGYRASMEIPDYFGRGRPAVHHSLALSAASVRPQALLALDADVYAEHGERVCELAGEEATVWRATMEAALRQSRTPRSGSGPDSAWSADCRFWLLNPSGRIGGAFGLSTYVWIAPDVRWLRWLCAVESHCSRRDLIMAAAHQALSDGARLLVMEMAQESDRPVLPDLGFRTGRTLADVYCPPPEWERALRDEYKAGLISEDALRAGLADGCEFFLYWKRL
jgi:GNAT superfamily N-acetyltransferase